MDRRDKGSAQQLPRRRGERQRSHRYPFRRCQPLRKLAETYPFSLEDTPCYNNFPGHTATVEYREGLYIGYRYYDTAKKNVLFPFGFGLSYTTFEYSDLKVSADSIKDTDTLKVSFKIKNTGDRDGAEVAELYVAQENSTIFRPEKELKGFKKVFLKAGEEKEVEIELSKRALRSTMSISATGMLRRIIIRFSSAHRAAISASRAV